MEHNKPTKKLLAFCQYPMGGLADYARAQAGALANMPGIEVLWMAPEELPAPDGVRRVGRIPLRKSDGSPKTPTKAGRIVRFIVHCLSPINALESAILDEEPDGVLITSYAEYLAPLWAWRLKRWQKRGVKFGAVVHDPVRDHRVGPPFWHHWSIAEAYSFLDVAFVHEPIKLDTIRHLPELRTEVVPHGLYDFKTRHWSRADARRSLDLPQNAPVFLSFGHIRDGKNLQLFIEAMIRFPEVHLVVAGKEQSSGQKPGTFYQELARSLGVDSRIRWHVRHIPEAETGLFFNAADHLLLTYSSDFRSASGVLAAAAQFRTPVLASGGDGPMRSAVLLYHLGYFAEPSDPASLREGMHKILLAPPQPDWEGFTRNHSWETNAARVVDALFAGKTQKPPEF